LHILLVLAFMALGRIKRPEHLRQTPPGELGKVIGLDRVPEVRTLREKITLLAKRGDPAAWMRELAKNWMENDPEEAGYLYLDGHVRVYHGDQAKLPRRYVSRERLCLRGTTDYWVNDALGRPFFVVSKGSRTCSSICSAIPPPLSITASSTASPSRRARMVIAPGCWRTPAWQRWCPTTATRPSPASPGRSSGSTGRRSPRTALRPLNRSWTPC
jgi:prepilin-type processing-associated H-X9-DG protein